MKIYSFCILMMAAAGFVACSSDDVSEEKQEVPKQEIKLSANGFDALIQGDVITRADTSVQNRQFDNGQYIDVYIKEHEYAGTTTASVIRYSQPITYMTSDLSGTMSPFGYTYPYYSTEEIPNSAGEPRGVEIYAVYPTGAGNKVTTFEVKEDQSYVENYRASDLMYGTPDPSVLNDDGVVEPRDARVPLIFHHLLSKIQVKVEAANEGGHVAGPDPTGSIVKLMNINKKIGFTRETGTLGSNYSEMTKSLFVTYDASKISAAIIPPQTVGTSKYFMEITLANNDVFYYTLSQAITFESGKKYTFFLTIKETKLSVRCVVEEWRDGDTFEKALSLD